jgi:tripartite-type tricarboxylate transporter receptor subunit TctC
MILTAGMMCVASGASLAQDKAFDAKSYFTGKTVRVLVGFGPGGGTDLQARHFAAYWSKYMPGSPRFQVTNVVPNTASANRLYKSPPDGLTIELTGSPNVTNQFSVAQSEYRVEENRIIGTHVDSASVLFGYKDLPYKTLREAMGGKEVIRMTWRSASQASTMRMAALSEWLNIPMKFISGPSGTAQNLLELERGDTDAWMPGGAGTAWFGLPTIRPGWLKDGTIRPIAVMSAPDTKVRPNAEIAMPDDVPYAADLITDPDHKRQFIAMSNLIDRYSKIFMMPPKTPDNIVEVFRKSYEALLHDKEFVEKLEVLQGDPVQFTPGDVVERDIDQMVKDYLEYQDVSKGWEALAKARF